MSYDSQTSTALVNKLRKDVDSLTLKIAVLTDSKPSGTSGGAGVAATWTTRDLNTIDSDPHSLVLDLSSNQFTLAAGAYQITAMAAYLHTGHTRMRLYDVTGGVVIGYGVSVEVSNQANIYNELNVRVQPHKDNVYRLEYYISAAGAGHLGIASSLTGISEIYAVCEITRLDTGMTKPTGGSGIQGAPGPAGPAGPPGPVGPSGSGTVSIVSVVTASGVSGVVANDTTTPAITLTLGAITPTSVAASGAISAGATVTGSNLIGVNTGDQLIILTGDRLLVENSNFLVNEGGDNLLLTGDITGSGTGRITAVISPQAVSYNQMQFVSASDRVLGRQSAGPGLIEEITCTAAGRDLLDDASAADQRTTLGAGTVNSVSVSTANGVSGTVANPTTTPAITIALGAITPTSVAASGTVIGSNLSGTHTGTSSGTNTGDQTISLTGDVTGTGTGSFAATIANSAVTLSKLATLSTYSRLLGSTPSGTSVSELILGTNLSITGNTLNAAGSGGTVTSTSVTTANGVSGTVANPTTTPAITIALGAITPSSVASTGALSGTNLSGTNTGDQTISLTGDVTGTGTGSFAATIANSAVTLAKLATLSANSRLLGSTPSGTSVSELIVGTNLSITGNTLNATSTGGTVTSASVTTANGVSGTVANPTTTPAISLTLGAITPSSVASTGALSGTNLSGTNTGDQTIALTGDVTGTGTGSFAATIANSAVTLAKLATLSANSRLLGSTPSGTSVSELIVGTNLSITGNTLNASGSGSGTVTSTSVTTANGVSGTVATPTTTPAITLTLGAITPSSVAATGTVTGSNLSGTNTGTQTISLTGDVTGSGTGSFAATIANSAVTLSKLATLSANSRLLGSTPSGTSVSELILGTNLSITGNTLNATGTGGGTVTSTSVTTANGVSGTVATATTTPAITLTLGAITPSSVAATGTVTGSNLSGTNTGNQTITLTGDVTGSGTGSFTATIGSNTVTYAKMQSASGFSRIVGSNASSFALTELSLGTNLSMTGSVINATGSGTGDVVGPASSNDGYLALYDGLTGKLIKQGAWRDFTNDFIGPAGSPSMTTGFPYIPKHAFPPSPSAVPINSTPGGTNGPLYLEVNTALFPNVNKLWVHNGETVGGWKYVNLI